MYKSRSQYFTFLFPTLTHLMKARSLQMVSAYKRLKICLLWLLEAASKKRVKVWMLATVMPKMERKFLTCHPNHLSTKILEFLSSSLIFQQVVAWFQKTFFFLLKREVMIIHIYTYIYVFTSHHLYCNWLKHKNFSKFSKL